MVNVMDHMHTYIKIDARRQIQNLINSLKNQIYDANRTLAFINQLSRREASKISEWNPKFESITNRVEFIKSKLLEPERV